MAERNNIPTVPTEDGWTTRHEGAQRASSTHATKAEALVAGRSAAMKDGDEHLTDRNGATIGIRNSYANDQRPPKE